MTDLDWSRLEEVLERLLDVEPSTWRSRLEEEFPDDPALRARVLRMLQDDAHDPAFLERAEPPSQIGRIVGAYELAELLGQGGMGEVWLAHRADGAYERAVAVKLLQRGLATEQHVARFHSERQVLAWLDHPGIARLLDGGIHTDGRPYIVMEYVAGVGLREYVSDRGDALSLDTRLRVFEDVCDAVAHAHRRGIVHRDLKPENVLVDGAGRPRLVDFGIAKVFGDGVDRETLELTHTGQRLFSPWYASPEQVRGEPVTMATDVYSLGVVLFELLTGTRPYRPSTPSLVELERVVCEVRPVRPSTTTFDPTWRRTVQRDLDWIVATALRKEPERRYPDAAALLEDLRRFRSGLPVHARPESVRYRCASFVRRHRLLVAGTAGVITLLSLALAIIVGLYQRSVGSEHDARVTAYGAQLQSAASALRTGAVEVAVRQLETADPEFRGWEWRHLLARTDRSLRRGVGPTMDMTFDALALSPDGALLAVSRGWGVDLVSSETLETVARSPGVGELPPSMKTHLQLAFHPDGDELAVAYADGTARVYSVPDLRELERLEVDDRPLVGLAVHSDGRWLAVSSSSGLVRLFDLDSRRVVGDVKATDEEGMLVLRFHPESDLLASGGWDERIRIWSVPELELVETLEGHSMEVHDLEFLADGRIVSSSLDADLRLWTLGSSRSEVVPRLHDAGPTSLVVHSGSGHVFSGDEKGTILRWDPASGRVVGRLLGHRTEIAGLACSPDGRLLFSIECDGTLRSWRADTSDVWTADVCEFTRDVAFRGDEFAVIQPSGVAQRWSWPDRELLEEFGPTDTPLVGGGYVDDDVPRLIVAEEDGQVWARPLHGDELELVHTIPSPVVHFEVSDGRALANVASQHGQELYAVDLTTGAPPRALQCPRCAGPTVGVSFLPIGAAAPGHFLVVDSRGHVLHVKPDGVELELTAHTPIAGREALAASRDGRHLVLGLSDGLMLWSIEEKRLVWRQERCTNATRSIFSPDGSRIVTGNRDGSLQVLDRRTGRMLVSLDGHRSFVTRMVFAPDGTTLATTSYAGELRIWDAPSAHDRR